MYSGNDLSLPQKSVYIDPGGNRMFGGVYVGEARYDVESYCFSGAVSPLLHESEVCNSNTNLLHL